MVALKAMAKSQQRLSNCKSQPWGASFGLRSSYTSQAQAVLMPYLSILLNSRSFHDALGQTW